MNSEKVDGLAAGLRAELAWEVRQQDSAHAYGNPELHVFATPALLALVELCAMQVVKPRLDASLMTVGTSVNLRHLASAPVGAVVTARGVLTAVEGRRLRFEVQVVDEGGVTLGDAVHERFVVGRESFIGRTRTSPNDQQRTSK